MISQVRSLEPSLTKSTRLFRLILPAAMSCSSLARSRREVPIPLAYRSLALWLRANGGRAFLWTSSRDDLLVSVSTFRHKYYKAVEKVPGVRRLSPHSCRHTYVSALERCHVPMEMIARLTGHSDIRTTDRYLHIDDRTLQDAVAMLEPPTTDKEKTL